MPGAPSRRLSMVEALEMSVARNTAEVRDLLRRMGEDHGSASTGESLVVAWGERGPQKSAVRRPSVRRP